MNWKNLTVGCCIMVFMGLAACGNNDDNVTTPQPSPYGDLTQQDHTLSNLELAYNQRNLAEMEELFTSDFQFVFSAYDYSQGLTPEQWNRIAEMIATTNMFDPAYSAGNTVLSINLEITHTGEWTEVLANNAGIPAIDPLYTKTFIYSLIVDVDMPPSGMTYASTGHQARLTIRQTEAGGKQIWQIVKWEDDTQSGGVRSAAGPDVHDITWGAVKALYNGQGGLH